MPVGECRQMLKEALVGRLATTAADVPYVVPVFFVYDHPKIYFHSAPLGHKVSNLRANPRACFLVDEFFGLKHADKPCNVSARYRSVVVFGEILFMDGLEAKATALDLLVAKYAPGLSVSSANPEGRYPGIEGLCVMQMLIERMTGKRSY